MRRVNDSLIKRRLVDETDGVFSIHRSLQRGLREKLSQDKSKQQAVFEQAVALVREVFPRGDGLQQPMPEKWAECQRLLPHLHALHSVYEARKVDIKGSLDFAQLLLDAGMDQFERGITHEGLLLLNTAENVLGANNTTLSEGSQVMRADIHAMIGIMYDDLGIDKRREAFWRREKALEIRKRTFEEAKTKTRKDEILVYNSEMEYAISLLHYHRYAEAEPIIERCLVKFKEWGSEEEIPFEYAKYYNKIALVRMYQGRLDEAIPLAAKGVQLMEKTGYSLFSSRFRFDMACMILQRGDLEEALRVHKAVYDQRLETVGPENQLSLHSMYAIGAIHELEGRLEEAEYVRQSDPYSLFNSTNHGLAECGSAESLNGDEAFHRGPTRRSREHNSIWQRCSSPRARTRRLSRPNDSKIKRLQSCMTAYRSIGRIAPRSSSTSPTSTSCSTTCCRYRLAGHVLQDRVFWNASGVAIDFRQGCLSPDRTTAFSLLTTVPSYSSADFQRCEQDGLIATLSRRLSCFLRCLHVVSFPPQASLRAFTFLSERRRHRQVLSVYPAGNGCTRIQMTVVIE